MKPRHTGNPFGPDGKRLKCHTCGSEEHLKRWCPKNSGKGGSSASKSLLAGLVTKMDAQGAQNVIPEEDYLDAEENTLEGQKESKFWMNFGG